MKILVPCFFIIMSFSVTHLNGQSGIEGSMHYVRILETNFLDIPNYRGLLGNPNTEDSGLIPANKAIGFEFELTYVKKFSNKFSWVLSAGIIHRQEQAECFCHVCNKLPSRVKFLDVNNIDIGLAGRYLLSRYKRTKFNIESGFRFPVLGNRNESKYLEFEIKTVAIRNLANGLSLKVIIGYEKSLLNYKRAGVIFGMGISKLMMKRTK